jgi:hypothetical protein
MANRTHVAQPVDVDTDTLRKAIQDEYKEVAKDPGKGFHFHTGRTLTKIVCYKDDWFEGVSESAIESFAGTGNPFALGTLTPGEDVVDIGSGGEVVDIDMTPAMLEKARTAGAGYTDFEITWKAEVFAGTPQASSASKFGTVGINFRANKP